MTSSSNRGNLNAQAFDNEQAFYQEELVVSLEQFYLATVPS